MLLNLYFNSHKMPKTRLFWRFYAYTHKEWVQADQWSSTGHFCLLATYCVMDNAASFSFLVSLVSQFKKNKNKNKKESWDCSVFLLMYVFRSLYCRPYMMWESDKWRRKGKREREWEKCYKWERKKKIINEVNLVMWRVINEQCFLTIRSIENQWCKKGVNLIKLHRM